MPATNTPNPRRWTAAELARLAAEYPSAATAALAAALGRSPRAVHAAAHKLGIYKAEDFFASAASGRLAKGHTASGRFTAGLTPWNKGKTGFNPGGRNHETRFKPGQKPRNTLPLGSLRINPDGHLQRKVSDTPGGPHKRWRNVAELVWTEANGPLPRGHIVVFKPGRATTVLEHITLDAVECISRRDNMHRNSSWTRLPPEVARLIQLKGAISKQVNRIARETQAMHQHQPTTHTPTTEARQP